MNLKDEYIKFFESKDHHHIPSAPVIPENDPTCLFNTAGMQPLVPYLMGEEHPNGTRLVSYQKCIRLTDLDEVGDKTHHTFFEMLGNWSLGDYFKEESIDYSYEFLTKVLNIPHEKLAVTVFKGDENSPVDEESVKHWKNHGIKDERIAYLGKEDNWWGPAGETGPCGPDSEIFYFNSKDEVPLKFDPEDKRWVEIWNNVFMEFYKDEKGNFSKLKKQNVDTGMGYERTVAVLEGVDDNYKTSIWTPIIKKIEELSKLPYENNEKSMRIVADHIRTSVFIAGDDSGIVPSNTDQGYILRRLIRRAINHARKLGIDLNSNWEQELLLLIIEMYKPYYNELERNKNVISEVLKNEKIKFSKTIDKGLKEFEKVVLRSENIINKDDAFKLYDTYGFPIELTLELATEMDITVDTEGFKEKFIEHQEKSRAGSEKRFKGGMGGDSYQNIKYHTCTHLLNAALKKVLAPTVHQKGSNITDERMRFDFSWDKKMTDEEKEKTEKLVNEYIQMSIPVEKLEMKKEEALKLGAEAMFLDKYGEDVTLYKIGDISLEFCGGPHVKNTNELGTFEIIKEEASSSGVRRIKAILK